MRQSLGLSLWKIRNCRQYLLRDNRSRTIQSCDQVEVDLRVEEGLDGRSDVVGMVVIFAMAVAMIMMMP
jgi:hypothetical protein